MGWPADTSTGTGSSSSVTHAVRLVNATGAITVSDETLQCDSSAGAFTLTLPAASSCKGQRFAFKKISGDGNPVNVIGMIDGDGIVSIMAQYEALAVYSDGSAFFVLFRG